MALSKAQQEKYGLIPTDASGFDEQRGIVEHKGSYYQVEGFQRQQKDGLDTDQGKVFSTSLIEDSGRAGEVSNFNTINDVQYALDALGGEKEESKLTNNEYVESEKLKQAESVCKLSRRMTMTSSTMVRATVKILPRATLRSTNLTYKRKLLKVNWAL